jgi:ABC-type nitrate/sulfonate/bicarbonate transport system ATPase subunit
MRLAIIRALVNHLRIPLMDERFSALNGQTRAHAILSAGNLEEGGHHHHLHHA